MPYATLQDLIDRDPDGEAGLRVLADRDQDGVIDAVVVDQALIDADGEIDGYLAGGGYSLPLATVPTVLRRLACDIAIYRMAKNETTTEERRLRYQDAVQYLTRISSGAVSLGLPDTDAAASTASRASFNGRARRMTGGRRFTS
jgi:phage gp36-like protein